MYITINIWSILRIMAPPIEAVLLVIVQFLMTNFPCVLSPIMLRAPAFILAELPESVK